MSIPPPPPPALLEFMHAAGWIPELLQVLMILVVQTQFLNFTTQLKGG